MARGGAYGKRLTPFDERSLTLQTLQDAELCAAAVLKETAVLHDHVEDLEALVAEQEEIIRVAGAQEESRQEAKWDLTPS